MQAQIPEAGAQGVLVAQGGATSGWSLYVNTDGAPVYTYVFANQRMTIAGSQRLPTGKAVIRFEFSYDGGGRGKGGSGKLLVDDQVVGEARIGKTVPNLFSLNETFDVGTDTKSPVGNYPRDYAFNGKIDKVAVDLK
ncbi:MAG: hypothetical protein ABIR56_03585 [Polaromonas sp.]